MNKPFNLEAFKSGQKALTRLGNVAEYIGFCPKCSENNRLIAYVNCGNLYVSRYYENGRHNKTHASEFDLVSMVSRHQHLVDNYDPEDTWQVHTEQSGEWVAIKEPNFDEDYEWRLHPHNDLIKAWKRRTKIELYAGLMWSFTENPTWDEDLSYRIKPEPVIHCLVYDAKRFDHEQITAIRARVVKKEVAEANGWKIIQEWEV